MKMAIPPGVEKMKTAILPGTEEMKTAKIIKFRIWFFIFRQAIVLCNICLTCSNNRSIYSGCHIRTIRSRLHSSNNAGCRNNDNFCFAGLVGGSACPNWTVGDTTIASIADGKIKGNSEGTTTLTRQPINTLSVLAYPAAIFSPLALPEYPYSENAVRHISPFTLVWHPAIQWNCPQLMLLRQRLLSGRQVEVRKLRW